MKLIINADDFGYSSGVNHGIIDAHKYGILTSTTLMTNTIGFDHAIKMKKEVPNLGIGVHLTLTFGEPILKNVDSLITEGKFHGLSYYQEKNSINLEHLYEEWDAQIKKAISAGINPTHLDSHHHIHTFGDHSEVIIELAKKYKLPVRNNFSFEGIPTTDYFESRFDVVGDEEFIEKNNVYLETFYNKIKKYSSMEVMCHPAYVDHELLKKSKYVIPRAKQVDFLINSSTAKNIKSNDEISLITYGELN